MSELVAPAKQTKLSSSHQLGSGSIAHSVDHRGRIGLSQPRSVDILHCSGCNWAFAAVSTYNDNIYRIRIILKYMGVPGTLSITFNHLIQVDVLEARYKLLTDEIALFSDQELIDCAYGGTGHETCKGGNAGPAFQYLQQSQRIADRRSYQYGGYRE